MTSLQLHAALFKMVEEMRSGESYGTNSVPKGTWEDHMPETTTENLVPEATWDNLISEVTWNYPAQEANGNDNEPNAGDGANNQGESATPAVRGTLDPDSRVTE